jgi:phospholipid/cholesterol/gamma-HCH transport system substrate-binding protein
MATGTNHYKLGLFVLLGLALTLTFVVTLGASNWNEESVRYVTYFDESVQGLEVGAPVKFRGVSVGRVAVIGIAPDQRHVQVTCELTVPDLQRLHLGGTGEAALSVPHDLRAQLAQAGLTGVKFVLIDFFDDIEPSPSPLPFEVPPNHIPAAPSTMKGLESSVTKTADRFPEIAEDLRTTMAHLNAVMADVERVKLPDQANRALEQTNQTMVTLNTQLDALDAGELSLAVRRSLASFDATTLRVTRLMDRLEREDGVLASAERSFALVGEMARGSGTLGPELELTLREVRGAARSIRRFTDALERDPDMLLKGRAAEK